MSHEATLFMTLLAAFQVLLYRYTDQEEIPVGSPSSGRGSAEFAGTIGYFVNPLVLRAKLSGDGSFSSLPHAQDGARGFRASGLSVRSVGETVAAGTRSGALAFVSGDVCISARRHDLKLGDLPVESIALDQQAAQFELSLTVAEVAPDSMTSFEYNTDLFDASTIERLSEHFQILLESVVADPSVSLSALPLLERNTPTNTVRLERHARELCAARLRA